MKTWYTVHKYFRSGDYLRFCRGKEELQWTIINYQILHGMWGIRKKKKMIQEDISLVVYILKMAYVDVGLMGATHVNAGDLRTVNIILRCQKLLQRKKGRSFVWKCLLEINFRIQTMNNESKR